jgi:hypothetical protein
MSVIKDNYVNCNQNERAGGSMTALGVYTGHGLYYKKLSVALYISS